MTTGVRRTAEGQAAVVLALVLGASAAEAGSQAGISERTVRRRLADPEFAAEVRATRRDLIDRAVGELAASALTAVRVLRELAQEAKSETVRSRSADRLLQRLRDLSEFSKAEARLADLEAIAAAGQPLRIVRGGRSS
jgi:signal transduction histidine kinase